MVVNVLKMPSISVVIENRATLQIITNPKKYIIYSALYNTLMKNDYNSHSDSGVTLKKKNMPRQHLTTIQKTLKMLT
jgi:hypothetical protein